MDRPDLGLQNRTTGFLRQYLTWACAFFALMGTALAFFGDSVLFEPYSRAMRKVFFAGGDFPAASAEFRVFTYGQLGGTIAGRWVLLALMVWHGWKRRRRWVPSALLASIPSWFIVDSAVSVYYGALFNVWMINIMPLVLIVPAALLMYRFRAPRKVRDTAEPDREFKFWYRWMLVASILPAAQGVFTAIFASPDPMHIYAGYVRDFFWAGEIPAREDLFRRFLLGPLGGVLAGYFIAQYFLVRFAWKQRWKWGRDAIAAGLLVWFCVDSTVSIMHAAWFNLYLVNVPTLIAVGAPILATRRYFS